MNPFEVRNFVDSGRRSKPPTDTDEVVGDDAPKSPKSTGMSRVMVGMGAVSAVGLLATYTVTYVLSHFDLNHFSEGEHSGKSFSDEFQKQYELWRERENTIRISQGRSDLIPPLPRASTIGADETVMSADQGESSQPLTDSEKAALRSNEELRQLSYKLRKAQTVEECMDILRDHPGITPDNFVVEAIVRKTRSLEEAIVVFRQFDIVPSVHVVNTILSKSQSHTEALAVFDWFAQQYPHMKPDKYILTTIMSKAPNVHETMQVFDMILAKRPEMHLDGGVLSVLYTKSQSPQELDYVIRMMAARHPTLYPNVVALGSLYQKAVEFNGQLGIDQILTKADTYMRETPYLAESFGGDARGMLSRSVALFANGREAEGVEVLKQTMLLGTRLSEYEIKKITSIAFAFLPEQHPIRMILQATLTNNGMEHILNGAIEQSQHYSTARERAAAEIARSIQEYRYSSGRSVFETGARPIDGNARREVIKM
jgi:hypothetical protein